MLTGVRRRSGHGQLWLVAVLVAMIASLPILHCVSNAGGSADTTHHQATHAALLGHGPAATHAHLDDAIHQLACQTVDGLFALTRGHNPLRVLIVLAALALATLVFQPVAAHLSRGPPLPVGCRGSRTGRDILTTLCVIRR
ncbi:putative copper homeostasis (lipo)protein LpqS [Mycobacteroides saopaulense]